MVGKLPLVPYIPVSDLARARKFYEEKLGMKVKDVSAAGVFYDCGGSNFFMYRSGSAGTNKASLAFWNVSNIEAEVADLRAKGIQFEQYDLPQMTWKDGIGSAPGVKNAWFKDTEGNILALIQGL